MINTVEWFAMSPYISAYIVTVLQTILLISYVWFPKDSPINVNENPILRFFSALKSSAFFIFGTMALDICILWIFGPWSHADWRFQLPTIILGIILGIQYTIGFMFIKPRIFDLIYGIVALVLTVYLIQFFMPTNAEYISGIKKVATYLGILIASYPIIDLLIGVLSKVLKNEFFTKPVWDIEKQFEVVYSGRFNIIIWFFALAEGMLKFWGTSLFVF